MRSVAPTGTLAFGNQIGTTAGGGTGSSEATEITNDMLDI